jgi:hypothetical protein
MFLNSVGMCICIIPNVMALDEHVRMGNGWSVMNTQFPVSLTDRSLIIILLVQILEFIHVLLLDTINLAVLVVHFPRLQVSGVSRKENAFFLAESSLLHLIATH